MKRRTACENSLFFFFLMSVEVQSAHARVYACVSTRDDRGDAPSLRGVGFDPKVSVLRSQTHRGHDTLCIAHVFFKQHAALFEWLLSHEDGRGRGDDNMSAQYTGSPLPDHPPACFCCDSPGRSLPSGFSSTGLSSETSTPPTNSC